jgi:hypothetical protein
LHITTYANHNDHKSTSGYVFLTAGGAITWKSKKQTTIALSSTQAEYVALSKAGQEACWLRNLFQELGYPQEHPTLIKGKGYGAAIAETLTGEGGGPGGATNRFFSNLYLAKILAETAYFEMIYLFWYNLDIILIEKISHLSSQ